MGLDWNGNATVGSMSGSSVKDNALAVVGSDAPWSNITTGTSWTLSLDISDITINAWEDILCLADKNDLAAADDTKKLQIQANGDGDLYFYSTGAVFGGASSVSSTSMALGINVSATANQAYTLTFVSDATAATLTGYVNGKQVGQWENWNVTSGIGGIQLAQRWGGGRNASGGFTADNLTIWNKALTTSEVQALIVPEPTTATLSLLALAGLAARRRRK